jgi:hypothetical protein
MAQTPIIWYKFKQNTSTTSTDITNDGSLGAALNAKLMNGATVGMSDSPVGSTSLIIQNTSKLSTDPTGQYLSIPAFSLGGPFTISFWFKKASAAESSARLFDFSNGSTGNKAFLVFFSGTSGQLLVGRYDASGALNYTTNTTNYCDNKWHHFVCMYNGTTFLIYVDNVLIKSQVAPAIETVNRVNNWIGRSSWPDPYGSLSLDDFRIYNTALNSTDLSSLYTYKAPVPAPSSTSIIGWFKDFYAKNPYVAIGILVFIALVICIMVAKWFEWI